MIRVLLKFAFLTIILTALQCMPGPPPPETRPLEVAGVQFIGIIGPDIGIEKQLQSPRDIAVNQMKEIYIADYGNDRIVRLDSNHVFMGEFGGYGSGQYALSGPVSLAIDNVSNLFIVDSGNARVIRTDRKMNAVSSERGFIRDQQIDFNRPTCIKTIGRGDIFIGDYGLGSCYRLNPFFNFVYDFGAIGSTQSIGNPAAIAIDNNDKIYVADSDKGQIDIFDSFGMALGTLGDNILDKPVGVAVSQRFGIWIADAGRNMLFCFDYHGREIFSWGGQGQYQLLGPAGLFITPDDIIYLADAAASKIYILKPISEK